MILRVTQQNSKETLVQLPADFDRNKFRAEIESAMEKSKPVIWITDVSGNDFAIPTADIKRIKIEKGNSAATSKYEPKYFTAKPEDSTSSSLPSKKAPTPIGDRPSKQSSFKGKPISASESGEPSKPPKQAWQPEPKYPAGEFGSMRLARNLAILIGLPLVLGGFLFVSTSAESNTASDIEYRRTLEENDQRELVSSLIEAESKGKAQDLPSQIDVWREQIKIADRILDRSTNAGDVKVAFASKIDALSDLSAANLLFELNDSAPANELVAASSGFVGHENSEIKNKAAAGLMLGKAYGYLNEPGDETFDSLLSQLEETFYVISESPNCAKELGRMYRLLSRSENSDHRKTFARRTGELLKSNLDSWEQGAQIHDEIMLGKLDVSSVASFIEQGDKKEISKFTEQVATLVQNCQTFSTKRFFDTLLLIEVLENNGNAKLADKLLKDIRASVVGFANDEKKVAVESWFASRDSRDSLLGTEFDLATESILSKWPNFESDNKAYLVVFYRLDDPKQSVWVEQILQLDEATLKQCRFVVIGVDKDTPDSKMETIEFVCKVKRSESEHFEKQCPISATPFAMTLTPDRKVHQMNLRPSQIRKALQSALLESN